MQGVDEVFVFGVRAHEINELRKTRKDLKTDPRCVHKIRLAQEASRIIIFGCRCQSKHKLHIRNPDVESYRLVYN